MNIDYHVAVDLHFYSVPAHLIHRELDVRLESRAGIARAFAALQAAA